MEETMKISTEDIRIYAKALRLSNLRNNCGDIIHKAQIDKPSYMDFIMNILKAETASRQQNDLVRRMRQAKLPRNCDLDCFDFNHSAGVTKPHNCGNSFGLTRCTISSLWAPPAPARLSWLLDSLEMP